MKVNIASVYPEYSVEGITNPKYLFHVFDVELTSSALVYADDELSAKTAVLDKYTDEFADWDKPLSEWSQDDKESYKFQNMDANILGEVDYIRPAGYEGEDD